jgi:hypothetical protein
MLESFLGVRILTAFAGFLQMLDHFLFVGNPFLRMLDDLLNVLVLGREGRD